MAMNAADIKALCPGPALDEAVSLHVMQDDSRWTYRARMLNGPDGRYVMKGYIEAIDDYLNQPLGPYEYCGPKYCHEPAAIFRVIDKFPYLYLFKNDKEIDGFLQQGQVQCKILRNDSRSLYAVGDTIGEAICKAALLAVMCSGS